VGVARQLFRCASPNYNHKFIPRLKSGEWTAFLLRHVERGMTRRSYRLLIPVVASINQVALVLRPEIKPPHEVDIASIGTEQKRLAIVNLELLSAIFVGSARKAASFRTTSHWLRPFRVGVSSLTPIPCRPFEDSKPDAARSSGYEKHDTSRGNLLKFHQMLGHLNLWNISHSCTRLFSGQA
jgi:hypothetical protein